MSTKTDERRLRDADAALALPEPGTKREAARQLAVIHDGIAALQSLDDLGSDGNALAMNKCLALEGKHKRLLAWLAGYEDERDVYMVNCDRVSGSVFVKELEFFRSQGGFREDWGLHWKPVIATSIEDARRIGCESLLGARPYENQAKP
jgi:hypothetical protein